MIQIQNKHDSILAIFKSGDILYFHNNNVFGVKVDNHTYILKKFDIDISAYPGYDKDSITKTITIHCKNILKEATNQVEIIFENGDTISATTDKVITDFNKKVVFENIYDENGTVYKQEYLDNKPKRKETNGKWIDLDAKIELTLEEVTKVELNKKIKKLLDNNDFQTIKNNKVLIEPTIQKRGKRDPQKITYFKKDFFDLIINKDRFLFQEDVYMGKYLDNSFIYENNGYARLDYRFITASKDLGMDIIEVKKDLQTGTEVKSNYIPIKLPMQVKEYNVGKDKGYIITVPDKGILYFAYWELIGIESIEEKMIYVNTNASGYQRWLMQIQNFPKKWTGEDWEKKSLKLKKLIYSHLDAKFDPTQKNIENCILEFPIKKSTFENDDRFIILSFNEKKYLFENGRYIGEMKDDFFYKITQNKLSNDLLKYFYLKDIKIVDS